MDDQEGAQSATTPSERPKPNWVMWGVSAFKSYRHKRRTDKAHESTGDRASRVTARSTRLIAVLTLVLAGAALLQYRIFVNQLNVMQGQLEEMKSSGIQTDKLVKAATDQAKVAQQAVHTTAQQISDFEHVQRAFLSFKQMEDGETNYSDGPRVEFTPRISNEGNTPTFNASGHAGCNLTSEWSFDHPAVNFDIGPHSTITLNKCQITIPESQSVYVGQKTLNVFGEITFADIFGNPHRFEFCKKITLMIRHYRDNTVTPLAISTNANCVGTLAAHNCSDDQCKSP